MEKTDAVVVGCGLSGAVTARHLAEKLNLRVLILERRDHIGGNMYDYVDANGILVHKYGPHTFHTSKKPLLDFMKRYARWQDYELTCGAILDGKYTPTPFNFQTIDDFFEREQAAAMKAAVRKAYPGMETVPVLELLEHTDDRIRQYAEFLFEKDYRPYTAKQWGIPPEEIDPAVLKRVPVRLSYDIGYFDDPYQVMPETSYTDFFSNILDHPNIRVRLRQNAENCLSLDETRKILIFGGKSFQGICIYTGAIDELFGCRYGRLPYRSLRFEWKHENRKSFQQAPVVAYPQKEDYTRITEYTKLPMQDVGELTCYAVEYPLPYEKEKTAEPYYPVLTEKSISLHQKYRREASRYPNLYLCGRLADFRYYNMDQALEKALALCKHLDDRYVPEKNR